MCFSGTRGPELHGPVGHAGGQQAAADHDVAAESVHGRLWHPLRGNHTGTLLSLIVIHSKEITGVQFSLIFSYLGGHYTGTSLSNCHPFRGDHIGTFVSVIQ